VSPDHGAYGLPVRMRVADVSYPRGFAAGAGGRLYAGLRGHGSTEPGSSDEPIDDFAPQTIETTSNFV